MEGEMKSLKCAVVAAILGAAALCGSGAAQAGCYRLGETGYHHYGSCIGPSFLYPHHRVCHHGRCWYR
jgi:hypothetical protein